jgi:putative nucleotidyltransferase with HDIG domain
MKDSTGVEELITCLAMGLGQGFAQASDDVQIKRSCDSFLRRLEIFCLARETAAVPIKLEHGQFVDGPNILTGASIRGRMLVELIRRSSAGGLVIGMETTSEELAKLIEFDRDRGVRPETYTDSNAALEKLGITNIRFSPPDERLTWYGSMRSNWTPFGVDLAPAVPVFQSMFDTVADSLRMAAAGNEVDMDEARTAGEELTQMIGPGFEDAFHLASYPSYDAYTVSHSVRVALLAVYVAGAMGAPPEVLIELGAAGLLHDVGKSRIPYEILYKPGRLDGEERRIMTEHPYLGAEILIDSRDVSPCAIGASWGHHLRFDGSGYPATRPWARGGRVTSLVQVCDVFEALTACRPYKNAMTPRRAYELMFSDRGAFEPVALTALAHSLGFYPPGSMVRMSDNSLARVQSAGDTLDRPRVTVLPRGERVILSNPEFSHLAVLGLVTEAEALAEMQSGNGYQAPDPEEAEESEESDESEAASGCKHGPDDDIDFSDCMYC